jgi:hypothetical protein
VTTHEKYGLKPLGHDAAFAALKRQQRQAEIRAEIEQENRAERKKEFWRKVKGLVGFLVFVAGVWFIHDGMHLALDHHDSEMMTTVLFVVFIIGGWIGYQAGRRVGA